MPFWRRHRDEKTPEREVDEPVDPDFVDPSWEPDPADFADPVDGAETRDGPDAASGAEASSERVDPLLPFDAPPPTVMTITIPAPAPTPGQPASELPERIHHADPVPAVPPESAVETATALDAGLERTRGGFMSRLRAQLGTASAEGPSWDDVEESLIAGDVGAALAIDLVERARRRRDAATPEAAIRTELASLLVARDLAWSPRSAVPGGPAVVLVVGVNGTGKTTTIGKLASRYQREGRSVLLAAADTFRAAAIDQLRIWA